MTAPAHRPASRRRHRNRFLVVAATTLASMLATAPASAACPYRSQNVLFTTTIDYESHTLQHGNYGTGYTYGKKNSNILCYFNKVLTHKPGSYLWSTSPNFACSAGIWIQANPSESGRNVLQSEHVAYATTTAVTKCFDAI